jgi:hypothetical protein
MRNTARCGTGHDRPESAVTIAGIRTKQQSCPQGCHYSTVHEMFLAHCLHFNFRDVN